jgi:hypothetical protein
MYFKTQLIYIKIIGAVLVQDKHANVVHFSDHDRNFLIALISAGSLCPAY